MTTTTSLPEFPNLKVVYDAADMAAMERDSAVKFADALQQALDAVLHNAQGSSSGHDAVISLILDAPDQYDLPAHVTLTDAAQKLAELINTDAEAEVVLLTPATLKEARYRFEPEYGESTRDNWVFRLRLPTTLNVLIWAIVDKTGTKPAYAYSFE